MIGIKKINNKFMKFQFLSLRKSDFKNEIFLVSRIFFAWILISKMGLKMKLRIITKNSEADSEIRFLTKSISKPFCRSTAMPPAWELRYFLTVICPGKIYSKIFASFKLVKHMAGHSNRPSEKQNTENYQNYSIHKFIHMSSLESSLL